MKPFKLSELFHICMSHFQEFAPLKGKGLLSKKIGDYIIKITADERIKDDGVEIKPFAFHIFKNAWIAAIVYPNGGETAIDEDRLIKELS